MWNKYCRCRCHVPDWMPAALTVFGSHLINFAYAPSSTFGNMSPYIASYLKYRAENDSVTNGHMVWVLALSLASQAMTMAVGGLVERRAGSRATCGLGGLVLSSGVMTTYYTIKFNLGLVIFTYGIMCGVGIGLSYSVAIEIAIKRFPLYTGLTTGVVVSGFGFGSLVFNIFQTKMINPHNLPPNNTINSDKYFGEKEVLDRVPFCLLYSGFIYLVLHMVGVLLMKEEVNSNEDNVNSGTGEKGNTRQKKISEDNNSLRKSGSNLEIQNLETRSSKNYTLKEAIKDRRFWILWVTIFLNGFVVLIILTLYKSFGQTFIVNDKFFSYAGGIASVMNSFGRITWGKLLDRFPYKRMMSISTALTTTLVSTFYCCHFAPSDVAKEAIFTIQLFLIFFTIADTFSMIPVATAISFGKENMAIIFGAVFTGVALSGILGAITTTFLLGRIHYYGMFGLAASCTLTSFIITQFFPKTEAYSLQHDKQ